MLMNMTMNYLTYPVEVMNITQNYSDGYSHAPHSSGTPAEYPIDDACADSGRDWFYCPCDEMVVAHIYGVGGSGTNTIWIQSTEPVVMPCGEDYVTILVMHPNDDTLGSLREGQTFKRGDKMFVEGDDGWATGYHFHIAVGAGKFTGSGWVTNSNGKWVNNTTGRQLKPEEAFWIDDSFTTVRNTGGIAFKHLPTDAKTGPENTDAPKEEASETQATATENSDAQNVEKKTREDVLYRVQIGAYRSRENAEFLAAQAREKGFNAAIIPFLKGDVDGDGEVTTADARLALRIATGLE